MTRLHATLTLDDSGDFVAAVPSLLGFHPTDSIVILTVAEDDEGCRIGQLLRSDLPAPCDARPLATHLSQACAKNGARRAFVLILGGGTKPLRHRRLVDAVRAAFDAEGLVVERAVWARSARAGEKWWCYEDSDSCGVVPDPDTRPIAAALAVAGLVKYPTREALAATLAPDPPDDLDRRAALLDARFGAEFRAADAGRCDAEAFDRDLAAVEAAIADFQPSIADCASEPVWDDDRVVSLAMALSHSDIRGECLRIALSDKASAALRLWTRLTRSTPVPERAEPACLLAIGAYLRGDGPLAHIALDVAMEAHPAHALATLLRAAMAQAIPPAELRTIIERAGERSGRREAS